MRFFEGYRCGGCGRWVPAGSLAGECPGCSGPLMGAYDLGLLRRNLRREEFFGAGIGVWRFHPLLPAFGSEVTLGEGNTPLVHAERLGEMIDAAGLYIKDESRNPTGSFKARGMAVAVSRLLDLGVGTACIPSAGNAGLALAAYGARAGIKCRIFISEETPAGVAEECRAYGADVTVVRGDISDAAKGMERAVGKDRSGVLTTFREPCRVEGKKTIMFELEDQFKGDSPDWILFPTGGGTGIVAIWKAYNEFEELGWLKGAKPHLAVVQSTGCAPIVRAFGNGREAAEPWSDPRTVASGIRVPFSRADKLILRAVRESGGTAVSVGDGEILEAVGEISSAEGIFPSPEGAAAWAGLKKLVGEGTVDPASRIVVVNTAGGARYRFLYERFSL